MSSALYNIVWESQAAITMIALWNKVPGIRLTARLFFFPSEVSSLTRLRGLQQFLVPAYNSF